MVMDTLRFIYSCHKDYDTAADALESYFAEGLVCEGEQPHIETRPSYQAGRRYVVTLAYVL
jgi:hypothetical protein